MHVVKEEVLTTMKNTTPKLTLSQETLRNLTQDRQHVAAKNVNTTMPVVCPTCSIPAGINGGAR